MRYETLTGLSCGQLAGLAARVGAVIGGVARPGGRPEAIGLPGSVAMVVALMRKNITQELAGDLFGCSQPTVSRRWDLIRPVIGQALAALVPAPARIAGKKGTHPGRRHHRPHLGLEGRPGPVLRQGRLPGHEHPGRRHHDR